MMGPQSEGSGEAMATASAPLTFQDFLERMRHPSAADLVKSMKNFMFSFPNASPDDDPERPDRDSTSVQEFLINTEKAFRAHPLWAGANEEELEGAGEGLEKYLMTKLFKRAFAPSEEERMRDQKLSEKMQKLQRFISPEHLDIPQSAQKESSWVFAQKELQKINSWKAPRDKLVCILNCCRVINNLLMVVSIANDTNPPGADDFLPVLIYIVIKANPPQLHSNLLYIQRYRNQNRLVSEASYFYTNLLSAVSFIESMDAKSLNIDPAEYDRYMSDVPAGAPGTPLTESLESYGSTVSVSTEFNLASPSNSAEMMDQVRAGPSPSPSRSFASSVLPPPAAVREEEDNASAYDGIASLRASSPQPMSLPIHAAIGPTASPTATPRSPFSGGGDPAVFSPPPKSNVPDVRSPSPALGNSPRAKGSTVMASSSLSLSLIGSQGRGDAGDAKVVDEGSRPGPAGQQPLKRLLPSDLEASGMGAVVEAAELGQLGRDYRFLYANSGDLTVGDVPLLLQDYKETVLKLEALRHALECHDRQVIGMSRFVGRDMDMAVEAAMATAPRTLEFHNFQQGAGDDEANAGEAWRDVLSTGGRMTTTTNAVAMEDRVAANGVAGEEALSLAMEENHRISGKDGWRQGPWRINPLALEVHLVV